mmetsp:Transcript_20510/g.33988  ORF Transcript_20510/g.33988 Transcript_20510/m.33988 type:complete len:120 (-) Transcript_20510:4-363(-)
MMPDSSPVEQVMFAAKVETENAKVMQKLCWERCGMDTQELTAIPADGQDALPEPARRCLDRCVSKFVDTALLVNFETQAVQMQIMRQQQLQNLTAKVFWGLGVSTAAVALGCYLCKGGD